MVRHLFRFGFSTLLLAAVSGPGRAQEPVTDSEKINAIYKQMGTFQADQNLRVANVEGDLKDLRRRVEALEMRLRARDDAVARSYSPPVLEADLKELRRRLEDYERRLREDAERARIARAFAPSDLSGPITLRNRTGLVATIFVDGRRYVLAPFEVVELPVRPAGAITYEVHASGGWGMIQPPTTRLLLAERPFTIFVNP